MRQNAQNAGPRAKAWVQDMLLGLPNSGTHTHSTISPSMFISTLKHIKKISQ